MEKQTQLWDLWYSARQMAARNNTVFIDANAQIKSHPGPGYVGMILKSGDVYKYTDISKPDQKPYWFESYDDMQRIAVGVDLEGVRFVDTEFALRGAINAAKRAGKITYG